MRRTRKFKGFNPKMNNPAKAVRTSEFNWVRDDIGALVQRCSVAEDLNKVYVMMYLDLQAKYRLLTRIHIDFLKGITHDGDR